MKSLDYIDYKNKNKKGNHPQAGASKLGNTMNAIDKGEMVIGEFTLTRAGFSNGMSPVLVSSKGMPFRTIVWLLRYLSFGVK